MDFTLLIYWTDFPLGGAMKPTTDGRWAHLACAIWIPGSWKHSFHFWSFNYLFIFSNALKIFQKPAYLMLREWNQLMGLVESTRYFLFHFLCSHTIMASFLCSPSPSFFLDICHLFYLYLERICLWQRSHIFFILWNENCQNLYVKIFLLPLISCFVTGPLEAIMYYLWSFLWSLYSSKFI